MDAAPPPVGTAPDAGRDAAPPLAGPLPDAGRKAALPLADAAPTERRDAARNRGRVLAAAAALFEREGVDAVDVRHIARAAGVGIGTIYRRFGDKGSLVAALLGDRERDLQDRLLSGPPPLGPGAPPRVRLKAFLHALAELTEESLPMLLASEGSAPGARYRIGAYNAWRLHTAVLLEQAAPDLDAIWFADLLLAPLDAARYRHQRHELGVSRQRLAANLTVAVDRVAGRTPPSG